MYHLNELFAKCIPFDKNVRGRIGGNPPKCIEEQIPDDYKFYATLVYPEKMDNMLSILVHSKFKMRIENNIYPSIAVKVIEQLLQAFGYKIDRQAYIDMVKIVQYSKSLNKVKTFVPYTVYFYRKTY